MPVTESKSFCPFHQSLITDYYQEIELSIVFSESYSDGRRSVPVLSESVLQPLTSIVSEPLAIPFCEPQTLVSKFVPLDTSYTHMSETPEIQLEKIRAKALAHHRNILQHGCLVHRTLW